MVSSDKLVPLEKAVRSQSAVARSRKERLGTRSSPLRFYEPCLATLRPEAPTGPEWMHEIKFDGYRAQLHLQHGAVRIFTRRGYDWTSSFQSIADAAREIATASAVLDGEIVVLNQAGASDFRLLQQDLAQGRTDRLACYAFDLLYHDGHDLRGVPLIERKSRLRELLARVSSAQLRFSDHFDAPGPAVWERACAMHLEGIVSKRRDSLYRSGRQDSWIKVKCLKSDDFPIVAFVEKLGANPRRIASLYLGRYEGDRLLYGGKAQTGFTDGMLRDIRERLDPLIRKTSPLAVPVKKPKATWVEPLVKAEVQYSGITSDGLLREAVFKGIREDVSDDARAREPVRPVSRPRGTVPKENILQLLTDAVVPSKPQLRAYWEKVADRALPYLGRRPLKLVRSIGGTTFYHMGKLPAIPASVRQLKIKKREGGEGTRVWVEDLAGLLGLIEMDVVELHPWNSRVDDVEHPDGLVIDLDPGEGIAWEFVVESALELRTMFDDQGLDTWPKLTGGKGVHVMVPIERGIMTHDAAHRFCKHLAQKLARRDERYTISASMSARRGRLFIDYLRNGRGTTAVGTYSPRARAGLPIAAPVTWKQLERGIEPNAFNISKLPRRAR